jgi:flavin reductase (DIM6/NTAB) family NADH-FMN oxidoreductase RutF
MNLKALHKMSYGLYVVTSRRNDRLNGQIANTLFQVTSEPAKIAATINKQNLTNEYIRESSIFAGSVLSKNTPLKFIGNFGFRSGRDIDKLKRVKYKVGKTGAPIVLDHAIAYVEAEVTKECDVGTHTIFVGEVVGAEILTDEEPMTYAYYHEIKRWATPETAPTYIKGEKERG